MSLNLIVSIDTNKGIGNNNQRLYDIEEDNQYFRDITLGNYKKTCTMNIVIMGRNTWKSIPQSLFPLKERINIIISRTLKNDDIIKDYKNTFVFSSLYNFMEIIYKHNNLNCFKLSEDVIFFNDIFIIGGSELYKTAIDNFSINKLYITEIKDKENDDLKTDFCFLPEINLNNYNLISENKLITNNYSCQYYKTPKLITCIFKIFQKNTNLDTMNLNMYDYFKNNISKNNQEYQYLDIMKDIIDNGDKRQTRNAITYSKFGVRMEFDLKDNTIPILTTKKVACKTVIKELLWFIRGSTDNEELQKNNVHIWDGNSSREFLDKNGFLDREENELGPIYGFQWRHSGANYKDRHTNYHNKGVDQLQNCIDLLKNDPNSRRMIVCSWNPKDLSQMALPPCHILFQWYVSEDQHLSLQLYQRSGDCFLGIPFNIMSYSILIYMVAHITGLKPGKFIHIIGDSHVYDCHVESIKEQTKRIPFKFPTFKINRKVSSIDDFVLDDFEIENYNCHETIKAKMIA